MKVLLTGGAGFIGSHLADSYIASGDELTIVDDLSAGHRENIASAISKGARFIQMKIQSPELRTLVKEFKPDLINHHAAQKSVRLSVENPILDADINILGIVNVLEAAREAHCRRILFASSGGVLYGAQTEFPARETHAKSPNSPYGVSKYSSELYLDYYVKQFQFQAVSLRYANIYGPRQDPEGEAGVVAIFCERMKQKQSTIIFGTGEQTRDFVFVSDVVAANRASEKLGEGFHAVNVGTGRETSVKTLHSVLADVSDYSTPVQFGAARPGEEMRSCLNAQLLEKSTGWKPKVSLKDGLRETFVWFKGRT